MKNRPLRSFRVENFKAIRDSGRIEFGWLTAFIGNNGVGKSSLVEALETFRDVVTLGVDPAFQRWRGFEHVWNKSRERKLVTVADHRDGYNHPLRFRLDWQAGAGLKVQQTITQGPGGNSLFIKHEQVIRNRREHTDRWTRNDRGHLNLLGKSNGLLVPATPPIPALSDGESLMKRFAWESIDRWQFLMLNPDRMGSPTPQRRAAGTVKLARDGANIAEYLNAFLEKDPEGFEGFLDAVRHVLPYAADLQPSLTSEVERAFYLKLKEARFEVPGWLLSTGTLRMVALLACLRHPAPPALLVVEEIENGLDPRTMHMLVTEIRSVIAAGTTQVILTTHSPYLLDLLDLRHIIVVEREGGQPVFRRPDSRQLAEWSKSFSPGQLYTMGHLTKGRA